MSFFNKETEDSRRAREGRYLPSRNSDNWDDMRSRILREYRRSLGARTHIPLVVVHPMDPLMEAIRALDRDDWNPEWPTPFYCRFSSYHYGGEWIILEALPELLRKVK